MPAKQKPTKRKRPDPNYYRDRIEAQVLARRKVCSLLGFWQACGHKRCLRARSCALTSNECFRRFWPLLPEQLKISLRAGIQAKAAGLAGPQIVTAIERAQAHCVATQETAAEIAPAPEPAASEPPRRMAAPAPDHPRIRML